MSEKTQAVGKFLDMGFKRKGDSKRSERFYIAIPKELIHNPQFPFKTEDPIMIRIEGNKLTILKMVPVE